MKTELFHRRKNGGSTWTERGKEICKRYAEVVRAFVAEIEEEGAVDLRDLQTLMKSGIDDVITYDLVMRKLNEDEEDTEELT
tara:strand:+ start:318 stop:563 length:246 start_codon:yes stop_codon:yes gene_type:complete